MGQLWPNVKNRVLGRFWWSIRHSKGNDLNFLIIWSNADFCKFWPPVGQQTWRQEFPTPNVGDFQIPKAFKGSTTGKIQIAGKTPKDPEKNDIEADFWLRASLTSYRTSKFRKIKIFEILRFLARNAFSAFLVPLTMGPKMAKSQFPPNN